MLSSYVLLAVAGIGDAVVVVVFVWFFRVALNTDVFVKVLKRVENADMRLKSAKLCLAAQGALAAKYFQYLISLEIPRKTIRGFSDGFRDAAPAVDFEEIVREESDRARRHYEAKAHRAGAASAVGAVVALGAAVAYIQLYGQWPLEGLESIDALSKAALAMTGIAILLGQSNARAWPRMIRSLRLVERSLLEYIKPKEEMSKQEREAAARSRKHAELEPLSA